MPSTMRRKTMRGKRVTSKSAPTVKNREFIVSIQSEEGGGRQVVKAASPRAAAKVALKARFPGRVIAPKGLNVIVTDTTKKRNAQTFY